jgi:uncharacterized protein YndB with AHSA1/START domain
MAKSEFVYVTYIKTSPDKLWNAITNPEFMKQYWLGTHCESEWKPGSSWKMVSESGQITDSGEILESNPPKRLVIKWLHEWRPELKAEGYSHCTFDIEPVDKSTKLTVTHVIDRKPSKLIDAVSDGWPKILSNLKSLIETGEIVTEKKCEEANTKGHNHAA